MEIAFVAVDNPIGLGMSWRISRIDGMIEAKGLSKDYS